MVGQHLRAILTRRGHIGVRGSEGIYGGVGNSVTVGDLRVEERLFGQHLVDGNFFYWNPCLLATTLKGVRVTGFIPGSQYKKSPGIFDAVRHNPPENLIFFDAFAGGLRIFDGVASPAVQQAVKAPRGAVGEVAGRCGAASC